MKCSGKKSQKVRSHRKTPRLNTIFSQTALTVTKTSTDGKERRKKWYRHFTRVGGSPKSMRLISGRLKLRFTVPSTRHASGSSRKKSSLLICRKKGWFTVIDLNLKPKAQSEDWQPEEIAVAVIALLLWIPMAFVIGGLL